MILFAKFQPTITSFHIHILFISIFHFAIYVRKENFFSFWSSITKKFFVCYPLFCGLFPCTYCRYSFPLISHFDIHSIFIISNDILHFTRFYLIYKYLLYCRRVCNFIVSIRKKTANTTMFFSIPFDRVFVCLHYWRAQRTI